MRITQEGSLLSLELPIEARDGLNSAGQTLTTLEIPDLLGGGSAPQGLGLVVENGVVKLASTNTTLPTEAGTAIASGLLDASDTAPGGTGGTINVLGNRVALLDATLQASGSAGGGTVRVGGDYRGQGTVPNADQTYVGAGSTIAADALAEGDGGRVIVWADDSTRFYGDISARGGTVSGDGGFAEVSGRETLVFDGTVNVGAANGAAGTLLLDPTDIIISNESSAPGDEPSTPGVDSELPDIFRNNFLGREITINATALTRQEGNVRLEATNDIIVDDDLSLTFATCDSFPCFIEFRADADLDGIGSFRMGRTQSINVPGTQSINAPGRNITISGANITVGNINNDRSSPSPIITLNARIGNLTAADIRGGGTIDLFARENVDVGKISNFGDGEGVTIRSQLGNTRVIGISSAPAVIKIEAGGIFQATGFIETTSPSVPPLLDVNAPENAG